MFCLERPPKVGEPGGFLISSTCRLSSASSSFVESSSLRSSDVCGEGVADDGRDIVLRGVERSRHSRSNCHTSRSRNLTSSTTPGISRFCVMTNDCSISPFNRALSFLIVSKFLSKSKTVVLPTVNCSFKSTNFYQVSINFLPRFSRNAYAYLQ